MLVCGVLILTGCESVSEKSEDKFVNRMIKAVEAQHAYRESHGRWAGDKSKDGVIGNTGMSDGNAVAMLRSHSLSFTLHVGQSSYLLRYGYVTNRGNAVFVTKGAVEHEPEVFGDQDLALCRYADTQVDGWEDGASGRVLAFSPERIKFRGSSRTFETTGRPRSYDSGPVAACVMLLE